MDAEKEQEVAECEDIDMLHPEFAHLNPDELTIEENGEQAKKSFRRIELKKQDQILEETRQLGRYQKQALHVAINMLKILY